MQNQENISAEGKSSQRRTRDEIKNLISNWRASKLSRSEFCRREGLSIQTFCYWLQRNEENTKKAKKSPIPFVPMQTAKHQQTNETHYIDIKFPNGLQCRFAMNSDIKRIAQITKELVNVISH
jgi:hypothetical protein